ncbi:MAG: hypothetical protein ACRCXX_14055 [Cetobacterium sp.]|uniref:hypothetical protein n=1 Tax=Cetobacterium sp. TaxID=2071632 RepID=UPI003F2A4F6A
MVLDDKELNDILSKLATKIGVKLDEKISFEEVMKKVVNQNLCYQNEKMEVDLFSPGFKNGFFIKNGEFVYEKDLTKDFDHDYVIGAKFINKHLVQLTDINGKKLNLKHDPDNGESVNVKFKEMPLCLYFKLIS